MRAIHLLPILLALLGAGRAEATSFTFDVLAAVPSFQDTGVDIATGDVVIITASGTAYWVTASWSAVGPNGENIPADAGFLQPGVNKWSLVGRVESTPVPNPVDEDGFVGDALTFVSPVTGDLLLAFNDDGFGDNSGSFNVTISIIPEPSTALLLACGVAWIGVRHRRRQSSDRIHNHSVAGGGST